MSRRGALNHQIKTQCIFSVTDVFKRTSAHKQHNIRRDSLPKCGLIFFGMSSKEQVYSVNLSLVSFYETPKTAPSVYTGVKLQLTSAGRVRVPSRSIAALLCGVARGGVEPVRVNRLTITPLEDVG